MTAVYIKLVNIRYYSTSSDEIIVRRHIINLNYLLKTIVLYDFDIQLLTCLLEQNESIIFSRIHVTRVIIIFRLRSVVCQLGLLEEIQKSYSWIKQFVIH